MTEADLQNLKAKLEQRRLELLSLQGARDSSAATVKLDQSSVGRLSRMDAIQLQAMAQENQRRVTVALKQIDAALRRMEDGSYGYCLDCEDAINPKRLEFDPATPLCIACAERQCR
jgi:DnaK suppressor protein